MTDQVPGDGYTPTFVIKWFRVEENNIFGYKPLAQIGPNEWYCLKQLYTNGKDEQWVDVGVVL